MSKAEREISLSKSHLGPIDPWDQSVLELISSDAVFKPTAINERPITHFSYQEVKGGLFTSLVVESYRETKTNSNIDNNPLNIKVSPLFVSGKSGEKTVFGPNVFRIIDTAGNIHEAEILEGQAVFENVDENETYGLSFGEPTIKTDEQAIQSKETTQDTVIFKFDTKQRQVSGTNMVSETVRQLTQTVKDGFRQSTRTASVFLIENLFK